MPVKPCTCHRCGQALTGQRSPPTAAPGDGDPADAGPRHRVSAPHLALPALRPADRGRLAGGCAAAKLRAQCTGLGRLAGRCRPVDLQAGVTLGLDVALWDADGDRRPSRMAWGPGRWKHLHSDRVGDLLLAADGARLGVLHGTVSWSDDRRPVEHGKVLLTAASRRFASPRTDRSSRAVPAATLGRHVPRLCSRGSADGDRTGRPRQKWRDGVRATDSAAVEGPVTSSGSWHCKPRRLGQVRRSLAGTGGRRWSAADKRVHHAAGPRRRYLVRHRPEVGPFRRPPVHPER